MPPSIVKKTRISVPEEVKLGADPPAQSTAPGQFTVWEPPFTRVRVNPHNSSLAVGLLNVHVTVEVVTVALKEFPSSRSTVREPPALPSALVI